MGNKETNDIKREIKIPVNDELIEVMREPVMRDLLANEAAGRYGAMLRNKNVPPADVERVVKNVIETIPEDPEQAAKRVTLLYQSVRGNSPVNTNQASEPVAD